MIFFEAGEMLHVAEAFIDKSYHPTVICRGILEIDCDTTLSVVKLNFSFDYGNFICCVAYNKALEDAIAVLDKIAMSIDVKDREFLGYISSLLHYI